MKATETKLLDFLKKSPQFIIPIYQRTYSWEKQQCQQLWNDIIRAGADEKNSAHFIGSVVYIQQGLYQVSSQSALLVIDGQQRLTTTMLLIEALSRHLGESEPVDGFSARKLRHYYLLNELEQGERKYKLLLTQTDRDSLLALISQKPWPNEPSLRIQENFSFFEKKIRALDDIKVLCQGLAKLLIVDIALDRDQDNAQLIFESMNSTGRELSQADLVRNFVLMGLEPAQQTELYESYWRPMEEAFGQENYDEHFDKFMRYYLTMRNKRWLKISDIYKEFKAYAHGISEIKDLVRDLYSFALYYCAMALKKETDKDLAIAFRDFGELKANVAYPLLLKFYNDYIELVLSKPDFLTLVRLIETYVFRRAICRIPTNSLGKTFSDLLRYIRPDAYLESVQAYFLNLTSYKRFPRDDEFMHELSIQDLYNIRSKNYFLRKLENDGRKERVLIGEYTIEHILPQNENLSPAWQEALGPNWKQVQTKWLHTLGNLTLTGYNSEYSDKTFHEKRDMPGGFKESPLRLNEGLGALSTWNEESIQTRAAILAKKALNIWVAPGLSEEILEQYKIWNTRTVNKGSDVSILDLDNYDLVTGHSPFSMRIDGKRYPVASWREVLTLFLSYLQENELYDLNLVLQRQYELFNSEDFILTAAQLKKLSSEREKLGGKYKTFDNQFLDQLENPTKTTLLVNVNQSAWSVTTRITKMMDLFSIKPEQVTLSLKEPN